MFTVHSKYIRGFLLYIRNWTIKDSALKKFSDTSKRFIEDQGSLTVFSWEETTVICYRTIVQ